MKEPVMANPSTSSSAKFGSPPPPVSPADQELISLLEEVQELRLQAEAERVRKVVALRSANSEPPNASSNSDSDVSLTKPPAAKRTKKTSSTKRSTKTRR